MVFFSIYMTHLFASAFHYIGEIDNNNNHYATWIKVRGL